MSTQTVEPKIKRYSPLRTAEAIYHDLLQSPGDVVLSPNEAPQVWRLFRNSELPSGQFQSLKNRAFLQAALMSAIEGSAAMGLIESLFRATITPGTNVTGVIRKLVGDRLRRYYRHKVTGEEPLYRTVVTTIAWSHRPYFDAIANDSLDLM